MPKQPNHRDDNQTGVITRTEAKTKKPSLYKVLLLNEMVNRHVTAAELARKLDTTPQVVTRIVDLKHATKIDTIQTALAAMGKRLILEVA